MEKILKQYIRIGYPGRVCFDENGIPFEQTTRGPKIGVMIALAPNKIGYSLISPYEDFDEKEEETLEVKCKDGKVRKVKHKFPVWTAERRWEFGERLATERAKGEVPLPKYTPEIAKHSLEHFRKRAEAYFK